MSNSSKSGDCRGVIVIKKSTPQPSLSQQTIKELLNRRRFLLSEVKQIEDQLKGINKTPKEPKNLLNKGLLR